MVLSYLMLCICRRGISFEPITTVDDELVATQTQIGENKKEIPCPTIRDSFSIPTVCKKEDWYSC